MTLFCAPWPKPLKRFTPPPDYTRDSGSSEEDTESEEEEEEDEEEEDADPNIVRSSDKFEDEFLKQVRLVLEGNIVMRDLTLSQWCWWRFMFYGMWHFVICEVVVFWDWTMY